MEYLWDPKKDKDRSTNSVLNNKKWRKDDEELKNQADYLQYRFLMTHNLQSY